MKLPPPEHLLIKPVTKVGVETTELVDQENIPAATEKVRENKIAFGVKFEKEYKGSNGGGDFEITQVKNKSNR